MNTVECQIFEAFLFFFSFLMDWFKTVKSMKKFSCKAQYDFFECQKLFQRNTLILLGLIYENCLSQKLGVVWH